MAYASKIIMTQGDAPLKPSTGTIAIYAKSDNGFYIKDDQNVETEIKYTHPTSDGNLHIPANSTTNSGKVLTAGASAGTYTWEAPSISATQADIIALTIALGG
jgi:hypothetical protein